MKIVSVIPIKLNNERLPHKNTKLLGGKELIRYICETLLDIPQIEERYVFCSNLSICRFLPDGIRYLKRPEYLDLPGSNFTQIFGEFCKIVDADIYVYAHATAPFVRSETIQKEIEAVLSGEYDSAFMAEKIQDFMWKDGRPINFSTDNLPRSQDLPVYYRETSGVYVFTKQVFQKYGYRIGENPYIAEIGYKERIDINTPEDFKIAEHFLNYEGE